MKRNKFLIAGILTCIVAVIVVYGSVYLIFKDRINYPFEDDKISYIKDNKDYARIVKKTINKIEISSDGNTKILENAEEISKVIANLNECNGYKISMHYVPLGSKTSVVLYTNDSSLTIYFSFITISINKTHYKTTTNYLDQLN